MDVDSKYETFGRNVSLDDISGIKKIYQPGLLSRNYFFNPVALKDALSEMCFCYHGDLLVYFRNFGGGIRPKEDITTEKRDWWKSLETFRSHLGKFPAGLNMEYYYGSGSDTRTEPSSEFMNRKDFYQAFIKLFDNAIQGFSCFVGGSKEGMSFSSTRSNYGNLKPSDSLIHDNFTLWKGTPDVLHDSATRMYGALQEMERTHNTGISSAGEKRTEIRIIRPGRGAVIGSLVGDSSVSLELDDDALDCVVEKYNKEFKYPKCQAKI